MKKSEIFFILASFVLWRIFLSLVVYFAPFIFSLQTNFLGGGLQNYLQNPQLWLWANFDGEHYLAIAGEGYRPLTYFFFPVYPLLIKYLGLGQIGALFISHISFVLGLFGFYKLIKIDYSTKIAKLAIILLLVFPTSFYFAASYTESLFFCLTIWSFYFFRTNKYLLAGIFGMVSSATRLIGVILLPSFFMKFKKKLTVSFLKLGTIPLGILGYMYYLYRVTGDPLNFFNTVSIFGDQRSSKLIMLPQVFYRYIVKIIPNLNFSYFPGTFTTLLEFICGCLLLWAIIYSFRKISYDYWVYMSLGYLIPTLAGSFSSMPRYVLVLFPFYIMVSKILVNKKVLKFLILSISAVCLAISLGLFSRGYWLS